MDFDEVRKLVYSFSSPIPIIYIGLHSPSIVNLFHCICFALSNGVPPQVVMKWTGHSDYKAMRPYIDIAEKTKAEAMKLIENAWGM